MARRLPRAKLSLFETKEAPRSMQAQPKPVHRMPELRVGEAGRRAPDGAMVVVANGPVRRLALLFSPF